MTLATGKRAYYAQREMALSDAYDYASRVMVDNMLAQDAEEGIGAFIEKRAPQWQDAHPSSGHVRPLSAPHPDGQTRTSP
jgi:hypothetical protein